MDNDCLVYHAAAMDMLAKNLCCEWAQDGIRVNSVKVSTLEATNSVLYFLADIHLCSACRH